MTEVKQSAKKQFRNAYSHNKLNTEKIINIAVEALLSKKGKDITVMDVSELTTLSDFFIVCHGTSDVQIKALADAVEEEVHKHTGEKAWKKEGADARSWIILDYVNIVIHVMNKEKREYYQLERLWNDAIITHIEDEA